MIFIDKPRSDSERYLLNKFMYIHFQIIIILYKNQMKLFMIHTYIHNLKSRLFL
jgi:hypothetical protein